MIIEPQRTEPLITKAYDVFRKNKNHKKGDTLVPTEEYIESKFQEAFKENESLRMTSS